MSILYPKSRIVIEWQCEIPVYQAVRVKEYLPPSF